MTPDDFDYALVLSRVEELLDCLDEAVEEPLSRLDLLLSLSDAGLTLVPDPDGEAFRTYFRLIGELVEERERAAR